MPKRAPLYSLTLLFLLQLLSGCSDDEMKNVAKISAKKLVHSKDRTIGADLIYSDSAVVKAKAYAPILDRVTESNGLIYQEMPKGVKIDFYEKGLFKGSITSDYAIRKDNEKTTVFKKNVSVKYPEGEYRCEELTWDENSKRYLSPSGLLTKTDGSVLRATNFDATQDFRVIKMSSATAETYSKGALVP